MVLLLEIWRRQILYLLLLLLYKYALTYVVQHRGFPSPVIFCNNQIVKAASTEELSIGSIENDDKYSC